MLQLQVAAIHVYHISCTYQLLHETDIVSLEYSKLQLLQLACILYVFIHQLVAHVLLNVDELK